MFDALSGKLSGVFDGLRRRGALNEADVTEALREVRLALLDADVALPVVKDFVAKVRERAVGQEVLDSVSPAQQVIKIVNDVMIEQLGGAGAVPLNLNAPAPIPILMVGLQGSGKTTTSGKLALRLQQRMRRRVLLASLDTQRPAAQLQLQQLAERAGVASLPIIAGQTPLEIARRAMETARREVFDIVILDTAGRLSIDAELMDEVRQIRAATDPAETLLVVDAMTGQDAVNTAQGVQRRGRRDRHRDDAHGRRCARRRRAVDARDHRRADQADGIGREARRAGGFPSRARRRPHPRHGRRRRAGREGRRDDRSGGGREARPQDGEGVVRPRGLCVAAQADQQDGQPVVDPRNAAGRGQDPGSSSKRPGRPISTRRC